MANSFVFIDPIWGGISEKSGQEAQVVLLTAAILADAGGVRGRDP